MQNLRAKLKTNRLYLLAALAAAIFFLARTVFLQQPGKDLIYTVTRESLVDTVEAGGTYQTASQIQVFSPADGVISELMVKNNAEVKKGDNLFHIEAAATEDQKRTALSLYLAAKATFDADNAALYSLQSTMYAKWKAYVDIATSSTYENSDASPKTENRVLPEFTTAQDNWLAAEANYRNQQSVIAKDQAALSAASQAYQETQSVTVTAPISGTVVNLGSAAGDEAYAKGSTAASAGPVLVIANLSNPHLTAEISEDYAVRVAAGQPVSVEFDALKNQKFSGRVTDMDTVGGVDNGSVTYTARFSLDDLQAGLKPGMTALITIETLRKDNVLDVPNSALVSKSGETYVAAAGSHKLLPVLAGTRGLVKTEITRGLKEGTAIIANP